MLWYLLSFILGSIISIYFHQRITTIISYTLIILLGSNVISSNTCNSILSHLDYSRSKGNSTPATSDGTKLCRNGRVLSISYTFEGKLYELYVPFNRDTYKEYQAIVPKRPTPLKLKHHPSVPILITADILGVTRIEEINKNNL